MADRACVAILEAGRLLMVRQTYRGQVIWTFSGGSIEPGETPEQAAAREASEEVCLDIEIERLLYQAPRATASGTYYCFLGRVVGGTAALGRNPELPTDGQELHELRWFALDDLRGHPEVERIREALVAFVSCHENHDL